MYSFELGKLYQFEQKTNTCINLNTKFYKYVNLNPRLSSVYWHKLSLVLYLDTLVLTNIFIEVQDLN